MENEDDSKKILKYKGNNVSKREISHAELSKFSANGTGGRTAQIV
jgi:hypothetical protein